MVAMAAMLDFQSEQFKPFLIYVTSMLPTKFQVNWLLGFGEEVKKRFSRWPPWRPSWISDQHDFSYF